MARRRATPQFFLFILYDSKGCVHMFQGFTPQTIDFLWGIRMNNNREWFLDHKQDYQQTLYEPMKELAQQVFAPFRDVPNMAYKLSRIYKDARMHPAVPYKESLWLSMRPEDLPWSEQPTLYFEIRPEGYSYGFVLWKPRTEMLERFRALLTQRPEEFPALIESVCQASGLSFGGECYARKRPCPVPELEPYYNLRSIQMDVDRSPDPLLFSPELADEVIRTLQALYPLYEYCLRFTV